MADVRWQKQWGIFHEAIELPDEERAAFVADQANGDKDLEEAVNKLLAAHEKSNPILDAPAVSIESLASELDPQSLVGQLIDDYEIKTVVGEGGMGVVYAAEQKALGKTVALKLIRLGMDTHQVVVRFDAERQSLAMMNHRNVAQVVDAGATADGRPYFVMEYINGEPITTYCDSNRLTTSERLDLFLDVCAGVQHAHQKGIVHRDLKPTNVLVTREDGKAVPKIIDFGIAKATAHRIAERSMFTQAGVLIGTPEYMSPEQATFSGKGVDTRTDVYSLGVLLYELLIGALPFEPDELRRAAYDEICRRIREEEPSRPSLRLSTLAAKASDLAERRRVDSRALARLLRGDLDWITMRALEKNPERRYASPSELAADLRRHINDEPVEAGPPSAAYRIRKFARRHTLVATAGSLVALSLVLGIATATFGLMRAQEAERIATSEARTSAEVTRFLTDLFNVAEPSAVDVGSITAREVLDRGVERIRGDLAGEPAVQSRLMQEMGKVYGQLGLLEEAEQLYEEALDIRRGLLETIDSDMAETLAGFANVKFLAGEYDEAINTYTEAIGLIEASAEDPDPLQRGRAYANLGAAYDSAGQYAEALPTLRKARDVLQAAGQSMSRDYGRVMRNLGISHWRAGDFEAARAAYDEALDVYDRALEPGHPEISYVVNSLAILSYNLKEYEAARPLFERGLANLKRTLGPEHRDTASMMNNLGLLLLEMGLPNDAKPRLEESLRIRESALGAEHEEVATSLCNVARLRLVEQDPAAARTGAQRCLAIREQKFGPDHAYVATALEIYAEALHELGESDTALEVENRASGIRGTTE